jgi:hypothetical protein
VTTALVIMNEPAVIFQYLFENLPLKWPITLKIGDFRINLMKDYTILVTKIVSTQQFKITDPNCAAKIAAFLLEEEASVVKIVCNGWARVVDKEILKEIANRATPLVKIWENKVALEILDDRQYIKMIENELQEIYNNLVNVSYRNTSPVVGFWLDPDPLSWAALLLDLKDEGILK